ncbi:hypothetical protein [Nocardioides salsibiostraticola]
MSTHRGKHHHHTRQHHDNVVDDRRRMMIAQWIGLPLLTLITIFLVWQAMNKV